MNSRIFIKIGIVLLILNILIFIIRNQGFNYKHFASAQDLYDINSKNSHALSTTNDLHFEEAELSYAKKLLEDSTDIKKCITDTDKLLCINNFLYRSVCINHFFGPSKNKYHSPIQLFESIKLNKDEAFQCGEASYLQAYFLISAGFQLRFIQNIQLPNSGLDQNSHVYNEVWLDDKNQWVISDMFQNRHLVWKNGEYLNAVDLYTYSLQNDTSDFTIISTSNDSISSHIRSINDSFFSKNYYLVFFKETDPAIVYSLINKVKHYLFSYSHFKLYDPIVQNSNILHRIKQIVFFAGLIWLSIFVASHLKHRLDRGKKHTKIL
jgi:hypothetical protein